MNGIPEAPMYEDAQSASLIILTEKRKKHTEYCRIWRKNNPDKVAACRKKRSAKIREYRRRYKDENEEKINMELRVARKRWAERNKEKVRVHVIANRALLKNRENKQGFCSSCGATDIRIEGHHFDYSKPFEITWLCYLCHKIIHKEGEGV
jgi:hypothetical protein